MALKFIIDTQLPVLLRNYLNQAGYDAIHTMDCIHKEYTADREIREIAVLEGRIIITKDLDFHDYYIIKGSPPKILLLKTGNCSNKDLIETITKHINKITYFFDTQNENFVILWKDFIAVI